MSTTERLPAELPPPDTDRPAAADPVTGPLLDSWARRMRSARWSWPVVLCLAVGLGTSPVLPGYYFWIWALGLVLAVAGLIHGHLVHGRWWPAARAALPAQAWRPVPAAVVGRRVLEPGAGTLPGHLRVTGLHEAERQLIARTGRIWVVGPDRRGWLTVRLDGTPGLYPARLVRPRTGLPALTSRPSGTTGTAADDPVTNALAVWRRRCLGGWLGIAVLPILVVAFAPGRVDRWLLVVALVVGLSLPMIVPARPRWFLATSRLPRLLRAGAWTRVAVTLRPWEIRLDGTANATGTVQPDGGACLDISLPLATTELLGTMWRTGTVWLAGEPDPGRTVAVGFPGYPLLGVARLS
ncbi:MAG TPA: hypothetical protein VFV67_25130 [Actinophytocola sp.]|uniref:hypothetical protein n=1 Tax=Actinophytocola sp. TaxID=1872138 RepID=UPI002DB69057|nr:hypothetical protein [Actinophytocola sp.]HEU5473943.1 hypothetical protein [Actinophytocola sp.]